MVVTLLSAVVAMVLWAAQPPQSGAEDQVGAMLARPQSPGTLVLMVGLTKDPRVVPHWRAALAHRNPQVRATAARLLFVTNSVSAVDDLRRALAGEADHDAAFEQAQALLALAGPAADTAVLEAARRLGAHRLAEALADARGPEALQYLAEFQALKMSTITANAVAAAVIGDSADALRAVGAAALRTVDDTLWRATLMAAESRNLVVDSSQLAEARTSASAVIRDIAKAGQRPAPKLPGAEGKRPSSEFASVRTIGGLPKGLVDDVLRVTGCKPGEGDRIGGAVARYNDRRALEQLEWVATKASEPCDSASRYLTAAGILPAPPGVRNGQRHLVLLPLHDGFLECLDRSDEPAPAAARGIRIGADIRPPAKVRDVRPSYPPAAMDARRQGIVILEATISASGCVSRTELLRSVSTDLDVAAIRAVTGWAFTPTLLDGAPVPVTMTVTVQFSLR